MKIGIISDTHGILREKVIENLRGCKYIIHGGDIGSEEVLVELKKIGEVIAVRGNNDKGAWANCINNNEIVTIKNITFYIVHDKKNTPKDLQEIDILIYGHSHIWTDEDKDGVRFFNPGSCGRKRFSLPLTMAIANCENGRMDIHKIELENILI